MWWRTPPAVRRATAGPLPLFVTPGAARPATVLSGTPAYGPPRPLPGPPYRPVGTAVTPVRPHDAARPAALRGTRPAGPHAPGAPALTGPGFAPAAVARGASPAGPCPPAPARRVRSAAVPDQPVTPLGRSRPAGAAASGATAGDPRVLSGSRAAAPGVPPALPRPPAPALSASSAAVRCRTAHRIGPPAPWGRHA